MNRQQRRAQLKPGGSKASEVVDSAAAAIASHQAGDVRLAERLYRHSLLTAADPAIYYNFGLLAAQTCRWSLAVACWVRSVLLRPGDARGLTNLAIALTETGRSAEALTAIRMAHKIAPDAPEIDGNFALILWQNELWPDSARACRRALCLQPDFVDALNSLGIVYADLGQFEKAVPAYRRAIALLPDFAKAHFNLSLSLLASGVDCEGWREFEWRWLGGARNLRPVSLTEPEWDGQPLKGRVILLYAEQGYGDAIQFVRFIDQVKNAGGQVILEVPRPLARLLRPMPGIDKILVSGQPRPRFDCHLALMSLPHRLGITTIPAKPYIQAPSMAPPPDWPRHPFKVGLVWAGAPHQQDPLANRLDRRRSLPLRSFEPLLGLSSVGFISLQTGVAAAELSELPEALKFYDAMAMVHDFADSAALIAHLDLVITVDTAMAHLAGAMGRPVWILSRYDACWRWQRAREDTPWYPTARLFRQTKPGEWDDVIQRVRVALLGLSVKPDNNRPAALVSGEARP